jgi:thioredoxin-related protein
MNRKVLSLVLALVLATFASQAQIIIFEDSLEDLLKQARQSNKEALVMVSDIWCGPCKMFMKNMVPKPEMGKYVNNKFVSENGETAIKGDVPALLDQIQRRDAYDPNLDSRPFSPS